MNKYLMGAAMLAALGATPAHAVVNTALIMWNGADIETATGVGSAQLATSNLGGITITLSSVTRATGPNRLTEGNILISNTDSSAQTLHIIAGANGYLGPSALFQLTGTIGVTSGEADLAGSFFADGGNTLNGTNETVVGVGLNSFDTGLLSGPFSFSKNFTGLDSVLGPYGMAERLDLTLQPGAAIFVQGASMVATKAIPEPSTWAMLISGFGVMALFGLWGRKKGARAIFEA